MSSVQLVAGLIVSDHLVAGGENKKSGPIGLAVILVLCVACYFLFKSMSKHLRRVREDFPPADELPADPLHPAAVVSDAGGPATGTPPDPAAPPLVVDGPPDPDAAGTGR